MKVKKMTYQMKRDLTTSLEAMELNKPRVIPYSDYSYNCVRVMIGRLEKLGRSKWEHYDAPDGTIIKKIA